MPLKDTEERKLYEQSEARKESRKRYNESEKGQAARLKYSQSEKGKATKRRSNIKNAVYYIKQENGEKIKFKLNEKGEKIYL